MMAPGTSRKQIFGSPRESAWNSGVSHRFFGTTQIFQPSSSEDKKGRFDFAVLDGPAAQAKKAGGIANFEFWYDSERFRGHWVPDGLSQCIADSSREKC